MMSFFVILGLLVCLETPGSRAVTPVFVKKGNDVPLDVIKADVPEDFNFLIWKFNESDVLVTFSPGNEPRVYNGRVEFSKETYSVKLKNLQQTDSGVYTARVTGAKDKMVAEYKVTVQGPVSPVEMTVDSVSSSSDSCNLTVTCRTQDSDISRTFRCVNQICSEDGGETSKTTTSGAVLHVYFVNHSIICNHSNQVSWTKEVKETEHVCPPQHGTLSAGFSFCLMKTVVFSVGLIIMVSAVVCVHLMEEFKKKK